MSSFLSVRALHEEGVPKKTIARRLGIDRRTVRKYINRIERGAADPVIASAVLDRLVHHAHLVPIVGESFRMKDHKTRQKQEVSAKK